MTNNTPLNPGWTSPDSRPLPPGHPLASRLRRALVIAAPPVLLACLMGWCSVMVLREERGAARQWEASMRPLLALGLDTAFARDLQPDVVQLRFTAHEAARFAVRREAFKDTLRARLARNPGDTLARHALDMLEAIERPLGGPVP